jgi:hypothetical protein
MGHHATNIAETVYYMIEGRKITAQRPVAVEQRLGGDQDDTEAIAACSLMSCCKGCGRSGVPSPSTVTTLRPATADNGRVHDFSGLPSTSSRATAALLDLTAEPRPHQPQVIARRVTACARTRPQH